MHFEIPVDDMERASKFYGELFGWDIKPAGPDFSDYMLINTFPESTEKEKGINGGMMKRSTPDQHPLNYITVEDIESYSAKVEELGGQILMPKMPVKGMGWNAVAKDTEGNTFGLWQDDKNAA
jgi:predicted enzyme related to lactoylglutathione lyase